MAKTTVTFGLEKETPGTYRFLETGDKADHKVGTLYVKKSAFDGKAPTSITVTIESK